MTTHPLDVVEEATRLNDPRNASERYDRIAEDFHRATGLFAPGKSVPLAMHYSERDRFMAEEKWRPFVNAWHERQADEVAAALREHRAEYEAMCKENALAKVAITIGKRINAALGHPDMPVDGMQPEDYIHGLNARLKSAEERAEKAARRWQPLGPIIGAQAALDATKRANAAEAALATARKDALEGLEELGGRLTQIRDASLFAVDRALVQAALDRVHDTIRALASAPAPVEPRAEVIDFLEEIAFDGFSATHTNCPERPCWHCRAASLVSRLKGSVPAAPRTPEPCQKRDPSGDPCIWPAATCPEHAPRTPPELPCGHALMTSDEHWEMYGGPSDTCPGAPTRPELEEEGT